MLREDEVISTQSATVNLTISIISDDIQKVLESYLMIFGGLFGVVIFATCVVAWNQLRIRIQFMNVFLTFIPEEKLLEEVTMHMLKLIAKMWR